MDPETQGDPRAAGEGTAEAQGRRGGCLLYLAVAGGFFFLLREFASTPAAAGLAALGAALAYGGAYLTLAALRYVLESPWYAGLWILGLVMLGAAALTLSPAAPGDWLAQVPPLWGLLDQRIDRLEQAIQADDVDRARMLAARGLGDPAPHDFSGTPLLHYAKGPAMVAALLEAGLDPDAPGSAGQTLLMKTADPEVSRLLLAAGADPNARDDHGFTALMHRGDDPVEVIAGLLEAGADVHATTESGRTVADLVHGPGRALLAAHAGGRPLRETGDVRPRGRDDWLVPGAGGVGRADASAVVLQGEPLQPGDVGSLSIVIDNPSERSRVLEVRAMLDNGVLFVSASHDGAVDDRPLPGPTSTVRWPWLQLPPGGQGRLELAVLARSDDVVADLQAGDWSVDVRVLDLPERDERVLRLSQERAGGPARVTPDDPAFFAGPLLMAVLVLAGWLVFGRRRKQESESSQQRRIARVVAGGCALLCLLVAANLAWSTLEPWVRFEETRCEVLDHRALATLVETSDRRHAQSRSRVTMQGHPIAAVAIDVGGERVVAAGWSTSSATRSVSELRAAPIGSTVPCWTDPDDPRRFDVLRSPSLGAIVGMGLLLSAGVPLALIAWRFGRNREAPEA